MGIDSRPPTGFSPAGGERPVGTAVAVAMSGGVDSSVAAALLLEWGYDVTGVTMCLWAERETGESASSSASGEGAVQNVRRVCDALGVPLRIVDFQAAFKSAIVDYFIEAYSHGLTPNPCLACPDGALPVTAKIRYQAKSTAATVLPVESDMADVLFDTPLRDITPGQSVVFYRGEEILGGGVIARQAGQSL